MIVFSGSRKFRKYDHLGATGRRETLPSADAKTRFDRFISHQQRILTGKSDASSGASAVDIFQTSHKPIILPEPDSVSSYVYQLHEPTSAGGLLQDTPEYEDEVSLRTIN